MHVTLNQETQIIASKPTAITHPINYKEKRKHYDYDFWWITDGNLEIRIDENVIKLKKNSGFIFCPDDRYSMITESQVSFLFSHFCLSENNVKLTPIIKHPCPLTRVIKKTNPLAQSIKAYHNSYNFSQMEFHFRLYETLKSLYKHEFDKTLELRTIKARVLTSQIREYIEDNWESQITISRLAIVFGYEEHYFCTLFKKQTGMTLHHFISTVKMEEAVRLLSNGVNVMDTAYKIGYTDPFTFSKAFKRQYGYHHLT